MYFSHKKEIQWFFSHKKKPDEFPTKRRSNRLPRKNSRSFPIKKKPNGFSQRKRNHMFYIYIRLLCETFQLKGGSSICGLGCSSSSFSFFLYFLLLHPLHSWPKNVEGTSPMECMGGRGGSSPHVGFATVPTRDRSGCAPPPSPSCPKFHWRWRKTRKRGEEGGRREWAPPFLCPRSNFIWISSKMVWLWHK